MRIKGFIEKTKEYLDEGENPPKGILVHTGPNQGKFYNTEEKPQSSNNTENKTIKVLVNKFNKAGFKLYEVGGSIRDSILGRKSSDADFTTDATPDKTKEILTDSGLGSVFGIGEAFGTVGLHTPDGEKIEITTFRKEVYPTNSRKPVVEFGKDLKDDLARRDFTFNALAKDALTGELIDPFGGAEDLKNGIIRTVGNSKDRFAEDPLRMLRAVRFACKFGFDKLEFEMPEPEKLQNISKERISEELNKILLSNNPKYGINLLKKFGLMKYVIPEVEELYDVGQNEHHYTDVFNHTIDVVDKCSKYDYQGEDKKVFMISALLHDIGKPKSKTGEGKYSHFYHHQDIGEELARKILTDLRYNNTIIDRVSKIVANHMRPHLSEPSQRTVNRMVRDLGDKDTKMVIDFAEADAGSSNRPRADVIAKFREIMQNTSPAEKIVSPISGNEIMGKFNLLAGKAIGDVKEFLTNKVMDGELKIDDKDSAYSMAEQYIEEKGLKKSFDKIIVKGIIEKSGGNNMWVEGIIKKGSSFSGPSIPSNSVNIPVEFRKYITSPSQAPGKKIYRGRQGGMFYDLREKKKAEQGEMNLGVPHKEGKKHLQTTYEFLKNAISIKIKEMVDPHHQHVCTTYMGYCKDSPQPKDRHGEQNPDFIFKPSSGESYNRTGISKGDGFLREVAGYELFKFMGLEHLCPPAVVRTEKWTDDNGDSQESEGSAQFWVVDAKNFARSGLSHKLIDIEDQINISAFDIIAYSTDRHLNNLMIKEDKTKATGYSIHCIDHGFCFPAHDKPGDRYRISLIDEMQYDNQSTKILESTKESLRKIINNKDDLHRILGKYLDKETINDVIKRAHILLDTGDLVIAKEKIGKPWSAGINGDSSSNPKSSSASSPVAPKKPLPVPVKPSPRIKRNPPKKMGKLTQELFDLQNVLDEQNRNL